MTPGVGDVLHIFFAGERGTTIGAVYLTTTDNETNDTEVLVSRRSVAVD